MIIEQITMNTLMEKQREVLQTLISMTELTCKEKGCMSYRVYRDIKDESIFSVIAEWKTRKDLERHIRSDRFGVLLGIKSLLREPLQIWIYTVTDLEGIEVVTNTRGQKT